jgi:hypothetical protein
VVIYSYNHHVRLLSPEPEVVDKPQSTRVGEPTLLCNHVDRPNPHRCNSWQISPRVTTSPAFTGNKDNS